jgi:hypothetical protein
MALQPTSPISSSGYTTKLRDNIRQIYAAQIKSNFSTTLGTVTDIVNVLISQIYYESHLNSSALGPVLRPSSSIARDYLTSPAIVAFLTTANPTQKVNVMVGLQGIGLGQSLGLNSIRGASAKTGRCLIETVRPDLEGMLCINPGEDLKATFLGDANLEKALMLQMCVLESKLRNVLPVTGGFSSKGDIYNRVFPSKISAAIAAYLGLGGADQFNTTPQQYSSSIVSGQTYATANGVSLQVAQHQPQTVTGRPSTDGSDSVPVTIAGC